MKPRLLPWGAFALPTLTLLSACATGGTFADLSAEHDRLVTLDTTLAAIGKFPSADVIAPDARLVSFPYSVQADAATSERRDTLVGPDGISGWLEQWHARQLPDVDFVLTRTDLQGCDGVAVQEGVYRVKGPSEGAVVEHQPYRAVWIQRSDGTWALHRLWLKPDSRGHLAEPATGCHRLGSVARELDRKMVEAEVLSGSGAPGATQVADAMRGAGWTVGPGGFPTTDGGGVGFAAGFLYRLTPAWGVEALVIQNPVDRAHGSTTTGVQTRPWKPTLQETGRWVGLLGSFEIGPARLAAGPALALVNFDWTEEFSSQSGFEPVSATKARVGGVVQLAVGVPIFVQPELIARYTFAPKAQVPAFMGLQPPAVSLGRFTIGIGLAYPF